MFMIVKSTIPQEAAVVVCSFPPETVARVVFASPLLQLVSYCV